VCYCRHQVMTWSSSNWCFFNTNFWLIWLFSQSGGFMNQVHYTAMFIQLSCLCSGQGYPLLLIDFLKWPKALTRYWTKQLVDGPTQSSSFVYPKTLLKVKHSNTLSLSLSAPNWESSTEI
jgi:hypothetical protein